MSRPSKPGRRAAARKASPSGKPRALPSDVARAIAAIVQYLTTGTTPAPRKPAWLEKEIAKCQQDAQAATMPAPRTRVH
jgi:hypothetical protein